MEYNTAVRIILEFKRHNVTLPEEMKAITRESLLREKTIIHKSIDFQKESKISMDCASMVKGYKILDRINKYISLVS